MMTTMMMSSDNKWQMILTMMMKILLLRMIKIVAVVIYLPNELAAKDKLSPNWFDSITGTRRKV